MSEPAGRIVSAGHGGERVAPDPSFDLGLADYLRRRHHPHGLAELSGRSRTVGDGPQAYFDTRDPAIEACAGCGLGAKVLCAGAVVARDGSARAVVAGVPLQLIQHREDASRESSE